MPSRPGVRGVGQAEDEWFDRAARAISEPNRDRHRTALERVRQRASAISLRGPGFEAVEAVLERIAADGDGMAGDLRALNARLDGPAAYDCGARQLLATPPPTHQRTS